MPAVNPIDAEVDAYQFIEQAEAVASPNAGRVRLFFTALGAWFRRSSGAAIRLLTEADLAALTFPTGARIKGDLSNATVTNRLLIENTNTNAIAVLGILPNGTGTLAGFAGYNKSDILNANAGVFASNATYGAAITSAKAGSAGDLPIGFFISGVLAAEILAGGNPTWSGDTMRLKTSRTPASASAAGNTGEICWDGSYIYVCVATNTWRRAALASW